MLSCSYIAAFTGFDCAAHSILSERSDMHCPSFYQLCYASSCCDNETKCKGKWCCFGASREHTLLCMRRITLRVPILAPKSTMLFTRALSAEVSSTSWYTVKDSTPTNVFWMGDALPGRVVKRRRHRPSSKGDSVGSCTWYSANHAPAVIQC